VITTTAGSLVRDGNVIFVTVDSDSIDKHIFEFETCVSRVGLITLHLFCDTRFVGLL